MNKSLFLFSEAVCECKDCLSLCSMLIKRPSLGIIRYFFQHVQQIIYSIVQCSLSSMYNLLRRYEIWAVCLGDLDMELLNMQKTLKSTDLDPFNKFLLATNLVTNTYLGFIGVYSKRQAHLIFLQCLSWTGVLTDHRSILSSQHLKRLILVAINYVLRVNWMC